jgi:hypothetical protein
VKKLLRVCDEQIAAGLGCAPRPSAKKLLRVCTSRGRRPPMKIAAGLGCAPRPSARGEAPVCLHEQLVSARRKHVCHSDSSEHAHTSGNELKRTRDCQTQLDACITGTQPALLLAIDGTRHDKKWSSAQKSASSQSACTRTINT